MSLHVHLSDPVQPNWIQLTSATAGSTTSKCQQDEKPSVADSVYINDAQERNALQAF